MATNSASSQRVRVSGTGLVNGERYDVEGAGTGNAALGQWDFSAEFSTVPRDVDPFANLLGILILPTIVFGRQLGDAVNLLTLADASLEFTQTLRGDDVAVQSVGTIRRLSPGELHWHSEASGDIRLPALSAVEPFDAVMLPQGPGRLIDTFALPFQGRQGRQILHAVRQVTFTPRADMKEIQFRRITIHWSVQGSSVNVKTLSVIRSLNAPFRVD
jgi:hypothetical protein